MHEGSGVAAPRLYFLPLSWHPSQSTLAKPPQAWCLYQRHGCQSISELVCIDNCANSRCHWGKWRRHTHSWYLSPRRLVLYCRLHQNHAFMCGWSVIFFNSDNQGGGYERPSMAWHIWSRHWHICNPKLLLSYLILSYLIHEKCW